MLRVLELDQDDFELGTQEFLDLAVSICVSCEIPKGNRARAGTCRQGQYLAGLRACAVEAGIRKD